MLHRVCPPEVSRRALRGGLLLVGWLAAIGLLAGCASFQPAPASYQPHLERLRTQTNGPIVASVGVLSLKEAEKMFDLPLHEKNIQPVFIRLTNLSTNEYYFLPAGLDPDYHPPSEVAYMHRRFLAGKHNRRMAQYLEGQRLGMVIPAGGTTEGFVFSNFDPGAKHVRLDILGIHEHYRLEFTASIPGKRLDYEKVDFDRLVPEGGFPDLTLEQLRTAIRALPQETTDRHGRGRGDPLNLVVVADEDNDVGLAFLRNNWDVTETLTLGNALKLVGSGLFGSRWRNSPVSALYVFGRKQDFALQKARASIHERNHLRLWLAPYTCEGRRVFVGQISRDIGLRFDWNAPGFFTHKIDPETDEARDYLAQEMILSGSVAQVAWGSGFEPHPHEAPGRNLTGDPWFTDGQRLILFLTRQETEPDQVRLSDWQQPPERDGAAN